MMSNLDDCGIAFATTHSGQTGDPFSCVAFRGALRSAGRRRLRGVAFCGLMARRLPVAYWLVFDTLCCDVANSSPSLGIEPRVLPEEFTRRGPK